MDIRIAGIVVVAAVVLALGSFFSTRVSRDTTPPQVSIVYPTAMTTMIGTVTLKVNATDNENVESVSYWIDSTKNKLESPTVSPYDLTFDSSLLFDGSHSIIAIAKDTRGNYGQSAPVSFTTQNNKPYVSAPPTNLRAWIFGKQTGTQSIIALVSWNAPTIPLCCVRYASTYTSQTTGITLANGISHIEVTTASVLPDTYTFKISSVTGDPMLYSEPATFTTKVDPALASDNTFAVSEKVYVSSSLNLYANARYSNREVIEVKLNSIGTIVEGPVTANKRTWWRIDFESGADGWMFETSGLHVIRQLMPVASEPPPPPPPTATTTPSTSDTLAPTVL